jgi:hypothetical protein
MRQVLAAVLFVGAFCVLCGSACAAPISASVIEEAAATTSPLQDAQFYMRRTRHHIIKCYREFVIGPYGCHRFYRWF